MEHDNDYREDPRPGIKQAACAWAILIALALLFGAIDLVWPGQPASLSLVTGDFTQIARLKRAFDKEDADEIDLWDGGADENELAFARCCSAVPTAERDRKCADVSVPLHAGGGCQAVRAVQNHTCRRGVCRKAHLGGLRVLPHPIRMQSARREMQFLTSPSAGLRTVLASPRIVA